MRKVMASLFERMLVSQEVGDLTDDEPFEISRLPKVTNVTTRTIPIRIGIKCIDKIDVGIFKCEICIIKWDKKWD